MSEATATAGASCSTVRTAPITAPNGQPSPRPGAALAGGAPHPAAARPPAVRPAPAGTGRARPAIPAAAGHRHVTGTGPRAVRLGRLHGAGAGRFRPLCAPARTPDHHGLATEFAQRLVEVLTGQRPRDQLQPHTTFAVSERLAALIRAGALRPERGCRPALHRVYESQPGPGAVEVCACVRLPAGRLETLAFRLELGCDQRGRRGWRMTALETSGTAAR